MLKTKQKKSLPIRSTVPVFTSSWQVPEKIVSSCKARLQHRCIAAPKPCKMISFSPLVKRSQHLSNCA